MTHVRVKGFKIFKDRHGRMRCYHRATGHKIDLTEAPLGSAEFLAQCETIRAIAVAQKEKYPRAGTLGGLIKGYFDTGHFANLAEATRRDYRKCADFLAPIRDTPVHVIDTPLIAGIHDKAAKRIGWRRANMVRTLLSEVFRHAIPQGLIAANYAKDVIPKRHTRDRACANLPWTFDARDIVLSRSTAHGRVALALIMNTGLDPTGALSPRKDQIHGNRIRRLRGKTGEEVAIPVSPTLQAARDSIPAHEAATVPAGLARRSVDLERLFHRLAPLQHGAGGRGALAPGLTPKGLRQTVASPQREAGED